MYIRFVIHTRDEDSNKRQGLFQAMTDLEESGKLYDYEQVHYDEIYDWFRKNLKKPKSFTRSSKPHAKNVALSWFKDTADEHIVKMHEVAYLLRAHGIDVEMLSTERPGYVVYEDQFQIVAEPFQETHT
ncbi:hypothetical protein [Acinetobacter thutiue]|jgi:hypothetical protein|uniref:hypothetical protein n=1 Tax=Acinetobacter TaxID=469 RepID=UPI000A4F7235|nr:hypothetical protein [Acinetobacter thutiue]MDM1020643.1 hypothetical protein [Acinetobacter thutiue]